MPSTATITSFYSFTANALIKSADHNTNFGVFRGHIIPVDPTTSSSPTLTYSLGSIDHMWAGVFNAYSIMYGNTAASIPTPSTTTAFSFYSKSDGLFYKKNSAGQEQSFLTSENFLVKGDILVASSTYTASRIGLGTDGQVLTIDTTTSIGVKWSTPAQAAAQSDQETGSSTTTFVSPGRQQYHPSSAKMWVSFYTSASTAIHHSYNITSLTDNGVGLTTVNIATGMSAANYCFVISGYDNGSGDGMLASFEGSVSGSSVQIITVLPTTLASKDSAYVSCVGYGDL